MRSSWRFGFAATMIAGLSVSERAPALAQAAQSSAANPALTQVLRTMAQNTPLSLLGTPFSADPVGEGPEMMDVPAADLGAQPEGARAAPPDQNLIVESANFAVGEERKLDGSVTPIFEHSESQPRLMVAQNTPPSPPGAPLPVAPVGDAASTSDAEKIKQLEERLDQRDVLIRDLLQRVEGLERERSGAASTGMMPTTAGEMRTMPPPAPQAPPGGTPPQAPTGGMPQQTAEAPTAAPAPGPGEFAVSEEDAQRALERSLVQTGAALLPFGRLEFVPSLSYQFHRDSRPGQIALTTDGTVLITENVSRSTQLESNVLIRVGLPWDMQAEIGLPWDYKSLTVASRVNGAGLSEHTVEVQGLGDPTLSLTKQVLVESDVRPGLFVGGAWNSNFGQTKNTLPLGTGFHELSVGLTAVKRQDPLVFTVGFTYQMTLENNRFKPGDQYIPALGVLLAVSPETSLRFSQQFSFGARDEFNGSLVPGSGKTSGIFTFGLLSILGRGLVVNLTGGIGETPDAPDFFLQLAFPTRLN